MTELEIAQKEVRPPTGHVKIQRKSPAKRLFKGLAGAPLAHTTPDDVPAPRKVLLHFCFDQRSGGTRPESCTCKQTVNVDEASTLVKQGQADWLVNKKGARSGKSIVIRSAIVGGEVIHAVKRPLRPDRRNIKHEQIKAPIRTDARKIIESLASRGVIPPRMAAMSDAQLDEFLKTGPSGEFITTLGEQGYKKLQKDMITVVEKWWANVLGYAKLDEKAGQFVSQADHATGRLVSGGHGTAELDLMAAKNEPDDDDETRDNLLHRGRVPVPNARAGYWNGGWDYSVGGNPHSYERGNSKKDRNTDSA